ncbi:MAG: endonuclease III [Alphaproteobacteria bacterium]|nr:endonuclease III [Alphaproteobacteria bacterium]
MTGTEIEQFFSILQRNDPSPRCELNYTNPYTLIVAIVLSAQSTDKGVNKATGPLFEIADTPQKMLDLGEERLKKYISTIGLYNNKAANIIRLSRTLVDEFGGQIPNDRDKLETLRGVGRKSANVWLNEVYGAPLIAVDTHVFRVSHRTGMSIGKNPARVEADLEKLIPERFKRHASHWLVLLGRYICTAKKPQCPTCPVSPLCPKLF